MTGGRRDVATLEMLSGTARMPRPKCGSEQGVSNAAGLTEFERVQQSQAIRGSGTLEWVRLGRGERQGAAGLQASCDGRRVIGWEAAWEAAIVNRRLRMRCSHRIGWDELEK